MTAPILSVHDLRVIDLRAALGDVLPRLPHVLRLLAENHLRAGADPAALRAALSDRPAARAAGVELTYAPNRLLMHDTTCTPALADIAGLRDALAEAGTISPDDLELFRFVETAEEAIAVMDAWDGKGEKRGAIPGR